MRLENQSHRGMLSEVQIRKSHRVYEVRIFNHPEALLRRGKPRRVSLIAERAKTIKNRDPSIIYSPIL